MVRKTCEWCGKEFEGRRNQRWCSADCRRMGMRGYWLNYARARKEKQGEYECDKGEEVYEYALIAVLSLPEIRRVELAWLFSQGQSLGDKREVLRRWLDVGEH